MTLKPLVVAKALAVSAGGVRSGVLLASRQGDAVVVVLVAAVASGVVAVVGAVVTAAALAGVVSAACREAVIGGGGGVWSGTPWMIRSDWDSELSHLVRYLVISDTLSI